MKIKVAKVNYYSEHYCREMPLWYLEPSTADMVYRSVQDAERDCAEEGLQFDSVFERAGFEIVPLVWENSPRKKWRRVYDFDEGGNPILLVKKET